MQESTIHAAIWYASRRSPDAFSLSAKEISLYQGITIPKDPEIEEQLRVLTYLSMIDCYDAWLFLRASSTVPSIPQSVLNQIAAGVYGIRILEGNTLLERICRSVNENVSCVRPFPITRETLQSSKQKLFAALVNEPHFELSNISACCTAVQHVKQLQRLSSYFNSYSEQLRYGVVFGPNASADVELYQSLSRLNSTHVSHDPTLGSYYYVPFECKVRVIDTLAPEHGYARMKLKNGQHLEELNQEFYAACLADEDRVVAVLEKELKSSRYSDFNRSDMHT